MGLRVPRSILAVPRTTLFWTEIFSDVVPGLCWSHSFSFGVKATGAPITTGTTVALHIFSSSSFSPWYFLSFFCSFLLIFLVSLYLSTLPSSDICPPQPSLVGYLSVVSRPVSGSPTGSWLGHSPPALEVSPILTERLPVQTYAQMFLYTTPAT